MEVFFLDANGNLSHDMELEQEYARLQAYATDNSPFAVGDRIKLTSACPKDTRDSCRVRVGDVGTLLDLTSWPVNDANGERIIIQAGVRWDHEEDDDPVFLGIFVDHLERA